MAPDAVRETLREHLEAGVREGVFPMGGAWVGVGHRPLTSVYAGGAHALTLWDVASLTKPMAVVTQAMRGVAGGWLSLEEPVEVLGNRAFSVRHLLAHRSGLPALTDLAAHLDARFPAGWEAGSPLARRAAVEHLAELARAAEPDRRVEYSDLGFILCGWHLEARLGRPLRDLGWRWGSVEPPADAALFAPAGWCPRRRRRLRGEVNDPNAWVLGGAAGHAGIFATLDEVGAWALDLERAAAGLRATVDGGVVRAFWDPSERWGGGTWLLGWDTPTPGRSSAGQTVSARAVGHLGFTGTSVWIDRADALVVVLLTNRVDLGEASAQAIKRFRPALHDAVRHALGQGA